MLLDERKRVGVALPILTESGSLVIGVQRRRFSRFVFAEAA
jgi:hypothetical protein